MLSSALECTSCKLFNCRKLGASRLEFGLGSQLSLNDPSVEPNGSALVAVVCQSRAWRWKAISNGPLATIVFTFGAHIWASLGVVCLDWRRVPIAVVAAFDGVLCLVQSWRRHTTLAPQVPTATCIFASLHQASSSASSIIIMPQQSQAGRLLSQKCSVNVSSCVGEK